MDPEMVARFVARPYTSRLAGVGTYPCLQRITSGSSATPAEFNATFIVFNEKFIV